MPKNKLYWEKEKKRGEKEGKKREKEKRKKEEKKKKEKKKRKKKKQREKRVGEANRNQKEKKKGKTTGEYLLILYTLSPLTSPGTCPSSWTSGAGPVVLIFRC